VNFKLPRRLVAGFFLVCAAALQGVAREAAQAPVPSANALVHLLDEHYRQPRTLRAIFMERYSEGQKEARTESGTVYFRRPGQMRWEYESPEKKLFVVDGKTSWFYVPYDHTVTKAPVKESADWRTPLALLTRKADLAHLCDRIDLVDEPGVPQGHAVLRCIPKQAQTQPDEKEYTEVRLEVDTSSGELSRIQVRQPGGIELEYRFGNWQTDIPLESSLFRFEVPKGVAIVDGAAASDAVR
jgi:outer membrane lipoprotein carrier protein